MIIHLNAPVTNASLQIGDIAYYVVGNGSPVQLSAITEINASSVRISGNPFIPNNAFLLFAKNSQCNTGGLKGYFAEFEIQYYEPTTIVNENKAELFAVGSEINISS